MYFYLSGSKEQNTHDGVRDWELKMNFQFTFIKHLDRINNIFALTGHNFEQILNLGFGDQQHQQHYKKMNKQITTTTTIIIIATTTKQQQK